MAGFGDKLLEYLKTVPQATTEELAKYAGVTYKQAYARLIFLTSQEKRVISAGKGVSRVWALPGTEGLIPLPSKTSVVNKSLVDGHKRGWKPDLSKHASVKGSVSKGDNLLVEYPEPWRHSMLCTVTRPTGYFGTEGHAQVWNLLDNCFSIVDVAGYEARGWKVVRVTNKKELERLRSKTNVNVEGLVDAES
jgi:hypothetical protein